MTFQTNNLTIVKADKSKAIVIIDRNTLGKRVDNLIQDSNVKQISKNPTDKRNQQQGTLRNITLHNTVSTNITSVQGENNYLCTKLF